MIQETIHQVKGESIDVQLKFNLKKMSLVQIQHLQDAENSLIKAGFSFDSGTGGSCSPEPREKDIGHTRDWQFDWSLKGPVKVSFIRFSEKVAKPGTSIN